ncbi:MAG TPA: cysteine synthase A, partial [Tenuifilaceae bacterium]|nr:cysteine synthase A [Tenuifilaceae bacterium]
ALIDRIVRVANDEAFAMVRRLAREEGMLVGISTGANLVAVEKIIAGVEKSISILTFAYDSAERYLSIDDLWQE